MTKRKFNVALLLVICILGQRLPAQSSGLSIVVIEGEGAVNIIQQKTAVRALVEVRDRNNLPVSGVAVTFSVGGQGASFAGGASTLTATTNAAGQAVVAGLTPTATGAVTINASAIVNGQTIAATISQTNFATVAEAAASAASAGGGGAGSAAGAGGGAGGGGLGTGAVIGIVAGGVAAAGGAAVAGGLVALPGGHPPCDLILTPVDTITVPQQGGTVTLTITVSPPDCDVDGSGKWEAQNFNAFASINPTTGKGTGTVTLTIEPFTANQNRRTFDVSVIPTNRRNNQGPNAKTLLWTFTQAGAGR